MKQRFSLLLFTLLCSLGAMAAVVASGNCGLNGDNVKWSLDDNGTMTFSGTGEMNSYIYKTDGSDLPWYEHKNLVKKVIVGSGVEYISRYAFYGYPNLSEVHLYEGLKCIGSYAFSKCSQIKSITIPSTVGNSDGSQFEECSGLESITIKNKYVCNFEFSSCRNIKNIYLTNSDVESYYYGFYLSSCYYSAIVTVPDGCIKKYRTTEVWKNFQYFRAASGKQYNITLPSPDEHGNYLTAPSKAAGGVTVAVAPVCAKGYKLQSISAMETVSTDVVTWNDYTNSAGAYEGFMPEADISIQATFVKDEEDHTINLDYGAIDVYEDAFDLGVCKVDIPATAKAGEEVTLTTHLSADQYGLQISVKNSYYSTDIAVTSLGTDKEGNQQFKFEMPTGDVSVRICVRENGHSWKTITADGNAIPQGRYIIAQNIRYAYESVFGGGEFSYYEQDGHSIAPGNSPVMIWTRRPSADGKILARASHGFDIIPTGKGTYYLQGSNGKYLNCTDGEWGVAFTHTPQEMTITKQENGMYRLTANGGTNELVSYTKIYGFTPYFDHPIKCYDFDIFTIDDDVIVLPNQVNYYVAVDENTVTVGGTDANGSVVIDNTVFANDKEYAVSKITTSAFRGDAYINEVTIAEGVSIGESAFEGSGVYDVVIGNDAEAGSDEKGEKGDSSIKKTMRKIAEAEAEPMIGYRAFANTNLCQIRCSLLTPPTIDENAFEVFDTSSTGKEESKDEPKKGSEVEKGDKGAEEEVNNIYQNCMLHVQAAALEAYQNHPVWGKFQNIIAYDLSPKTDIEKTADIKDAILNGNYDSELDINNDGKVDVLDITEMIRKMNESK